MTSEELERQLDQLRTDVVRMGEHVDGMLAGALTALADGDTVAADDVMGRDDEVDGAYAHVQNSVLAVVALHGPVGRELRMLTALLHISLHLERMGDYASSVARTTKHAARFEPDVDLVEQLLEMGELARAVGQQAIRSFVQDDVELAREVGRLDEAVDRLNNGIFRRLIRLAGDEETSLEWATRMIQLTRHIERFADHGVDVAEQVVFVTTGEIVELGSDERR